MIKNRRGTPECTLLWKPLFGIFPGRMVRGRLWLAVSAMVPGGTMKTGFACRPILLGWLWNYLENKYV
jgi:hypothetical protein